MKSLIFITKGPIFGTEKVPFKEQNMTTINVSTDIIPVGELKKKLSHYLTNVRTTGHSLVITQNGKPAGVLISPAEFDKMVYKEAFIESVNRGLSDAEAGRLYSTTEIKEELKNRRDS
jgi:prevent-host-death family protein